MICIDNLCELLKLCIENCESGLCFPQNREYMQISGMARIIPQKPGLQMFFRPMAGLAVKLTIPFLSLTQKTFGSRICRETEHHDSSYGIRDNAWFVADSVF